MAGNAVNSTVCKVLPRQCLFVTLNQGLEAAKMRFVERLRPANRHANTVKRDWMLAANAFQTTMGGSARTHIVLGVNLEKASSRTVGQNVVEVLMLEACPNQSL